MNKKNRIGFIHSLFPFFVAAAFLLTLNSCKTSQKSISPIVRDVKTEDKSAPDLQHQIDSSSFKASTISAKASVNSAIGNSNNSFNINLRLKTDSVIWISISPLLGIEVARVMITRDSVKFIDRLNNRYSVTDYQLLNELFNVNVDFDIIQGVLTGNLFSYKKNKFNSVYLEDRYYILSTLSKRNLKRSLEDADVNKPIVQDIWVDGANYRITRLSIEDQRNKKSLLTDYSDHRITDGGLFPFQSKTVIQSEQQIKIDIEYSKINLNTILDFPFKIPAGYEKIN
jgi:outer membrane lipoprotein-sorting protein